MTAFEFRALGQRLGTTQGELADLLGVNRRTLERWLSGERPVPPIAERFVLILIGARVSPRKARDILALNHPGETP